MADISFIKNIFLFSIILHNAFLIQSILTLSPIHHIGQNLTKVNELLVYEIFEKTNNFYSKHMTKIISDFTSKTNETNVTIIYATQKSPLSFRRKNIFRLKPYDSNRLYLNDLVRCSIVFKSKTSLMKFIKYFKGKYGNHIVSFHDTMGKKDSRYKVINIKYYHPQPFLSLNVYANQKCYQYPLLEIQLQLEYNFKYRCVTHNLYDGFRSFHSMELYYNDSFLHTPIDYLNDQMSFHPLHILLWINRKTKKDYLSHFEIFYYKTLYYMIHEFSLFLHRKEFREFQSRYLLICSLFTKHKIDHNQLIPLAIVIKLKNSINSLLSNIFAAANVKDFGQ